MKKTAIIKTEKIDKRLSKEKQKIKIVNTTNKLKASGYTNITHDMVSYIEYKGVKMKNDNTNTPPWFVAFEKVNNARWANLETDMTEVKDRLTNVENDISILKSDMVEVKLDIAELKSNMVEVKSDITELKSLPTIAKELKENN